MESRTIKVSEDKYKKLLALATELQKKREEKVTFDDAIGNLLEEKEKKKGSIMDLAGAWKDMSDEEWTEIKDSLKRGWKKWKTAYV